MSDWPRNAKEVNENRPPVRPRRSFDAKIVEPKSGNNDGRYILSASGTVAGFGSVTRVGMSHLSTSMPALGRYGSLSRPNRANAESPILGWWTPDGRSPWEPAPRETRREDGLAHEHPTIPVLPPVAPCERFDHKQLRSTICAQPYESNENEKGWNRGREQSRDDRGSPVSASSTGTSTLFGSQESDRRLSE
ncbi:hypothetical protein F4782DRAFT_377847 [Xylaria castorea]|nr:hypothetical protein F4782DRAFT_377847 [Xylaria castorea]